ncbi:MAG: hypothetical protein J0M18_07080 [Ignavibacteria bacterium]|nr:hypothetical protein [Ignavibacteria bacterium]
MEDKNTTLAGELFLKGEHIQTQIFSFTSSEKVITVKMQSVFKRIEEKDFKQECTFTISPEGYVRVQIDFKGNGKESSVRLRKIDLNKIEIYHNSVFKEIIETDNNEKFLFDGVNPLFDFYNYVYFISSEDNVKIERRVFYIDHIEGKLTKKNYTFEKKDNKVIINKGEGGNEVSIELWEGSYDLKKIKTKETVNFFNR